MKILFWGETAGNAGPMNINKGIVGSLSDSFLYVKAKMKPMALLESLIRLLRCDAVVVSGVSTIGCILVSVAGILGKKRIYIIHGCNVYETMLNRRMPDKKGERQETHLLENCDFLLPVSRKFMLWVRERYPQYADKTGYLYNGIDPEIFCRKITGEKIPGMVIADGGIRVEKNNGPVAEAVAGMEGTAQLDVYGFVGEDAPVYQYSRFMGIVDHQVYLEQLSCAGLYVLNSIFESFSISVLEALACGCSILVSEIAGVTDLLALEETDVIHDPMDAEEIRGKIGYLLAHPNNERIRKQFDVSEWSFDKMVERLEEICGKLIHNIPQQME